MGRLDHLGSLFLALEPESLQFKDVFSRKAKRHVFRSLIRGGGELYQSLGEKILD